MFEIIGINLNKTLLDITGSICYVGKKVKKKGLPQITFSRVRKSNFLKDIYILAESGKKSRRVCLRNCDKTGKGVLKIGELCYV